MKRGADDPTLKHASVINLYTANCYIENSYILLPLHSTLHLLHWNDFRVPKPPSKSSVKKRHQKKGSIVEESVYDKAHIIDIIGSGPQTTICGHVDLLRLLPLHNGMHRKLLETFRDKPGNYEGKYNGNESRRAKVVDYGNGYLALELSDDITRPEMSEFLLAHDWRMLNANCSSHDGIDTIYEKWTNLIPDGTSKDKKRQLPPTYDMQTTYAMPPQRYY